MSLVLTAVLLSSIGISGTGPAPGNGVQAQRRFATETLPQPRFADPERARKLATAFPEIERMFRERVERQHMPGAVIGIIIDGELVWVKSAGVANVKSRVPVTPDTVFRIASMTKSFTAVAILKLRDQGKLSLDDPVSKYVPSLADLPYPTKDSPALTIRHLLTHSEGFPEDNPWGDRQLAQTDETMKIWMRGGIPFSNAPGVAFEYSNYGFAILGQIVARASGKAYEDYVRDQILLPLGMRSSTFEASQVPRDRVAPGYRWEDNAWKDEPILAHGSFGAMGGLWTSANDLALYVSFLMSAFPPRDEVEKGPIHRSSAREMQQAARWQPAFALRPTVDGPLQLGVSTYAYGLGVTQDCRFSHVVGHGGGLPGYGSLMRWWPEYGVGMIAMGNLTYAGFGGLFGDAAAALHGTGAMQPRVVQPSRALLAAQKDVSQLIIKWDDELATRIAADNLFLDETLARRATRMRELTVRHGACSPATTIDAENALRGRWRMPCERGWLDVFITLAPTMPPRVQFINVQSTLPPDERMAKALGSVMRLVNGWDEKTAEGLTAPGLDIERMRRQTSAASLWGTCKLGEALGGDGKRDSAVKLICQRGNLLARLSLDAETNRVKSLDLIPTRDQRCVP
ncbi:MAG: beta-lactamase family protein [Acidobacteriota bacterium]|nr:beta-lactamase family protein [Acidobacteriota bacterium]